MCTTSKSLFNTWMNLKVMENIDCVGSVDQYKITVGISILNYL